MRLDTNLHQGNGKADRLATRMKKIGSEWYAYSFGFERRAKFYLSLNEEDKDEIEKTSYFWQFLDDLSYTMLNGRACERVCKELLVDILYKVSDSKRFEVEKENRKYIKEASAFFNNGWKNNRVISIAAK